MTDKAVFLDRDDTLIEDTGYINDPDQVKLLPGICEALTQLKSMGYKLVVVSNQSGIARGILTEKTLARIHDRLKELLAEKGALLDKIYYCPYLADGAVEKYRKESNDRKPNPGMLLTTAKEMNIELESSWMVGDEPRDIEAGLRAGCKTILVDNPRHPLELSTLTARPHFRAVNMKEVVNIIKKHDRAADKPPNQNQTPQDSQIEENPHEPSQAELDNKQDAASDQSPLLNKTEQLLQGILEQLKTMQRPDMFAEFSITRFMAGVVQFVVLFCLLIALWFLMSPERQLNPILIALGFAIALQLMSLTLYMMRGRR